MAELRVTVKVDDAGDGAEELDALADSLRRGADLAERPRMLQEPTDEGGLQPMFLLKVGDAATATAAMRALGGWYMRHPQRVVVLKVTGAGGRVALELKRFSTVAFAEATAKVRDAVTRRDADAG